MSKWSRLILSHLRHITVPGPRLFPARPSSPTIIRLFSTASELEKTRKAIQEILFEVERDKQREREERKRKGLDTADIDAEDEEDFMGVGPLIEKLEKENLRGEREMYEEMTESESDDDDDRWSTEEVEKRSDDFEKKFQRHQELLKGFTDARNLLILLRHFPFLHFFGKFR